MKNILYGFTALALLAAVFVAAAPDNGLMMNGKSDVQHLYLYEKDAAWAIVDGGAEGKMQFDSDSFVFNGHGLQPGVEYALIFYQEPWPSTEIQVLGTGVANNGGNVNIKNAEFMFCELSETVYSYGTGAKIWLVKNSDVGYDTDGNPTQMIGWNPSEYLFEYNLISVPDCA